MSKIDTQSLSNIIEKINRNIITSFLIISVSFFIVVSVVFVEYKNAENSDISQNLNATIKAYKAKISKELIAITMLDDFISYIHSGPISRKNHYVSFVARILDLNIDVIAGMEIFDNAGENIFVYGEKTNDSVILDLCYLNSKLLNFDVGNCSHRWKLYFKSDIMAKELKELDPELVDCDNCGQKIVDGKYFGDFPMSQFSNMLVKLDVKKRPATVLWEMSFSILSLLLILIIWNINRIKSIFRRYLSEPIIEITSKIKENKELPKVAVEELLYLTEQIARWKEQLIDLEKIKLQEKTKEESIKAMQLIGASIAHELRTPLRSMMSGAAGIEKFLPILLESYTLASKANLLNKTIKPQQVELLRKVLSNLRTEGVSANTIIDMLLMKIKGSIGGTSDIKRMFIGECLTEALRRYGFQRYELNLISYDMRNDFEIDGDKILVIHILFNLLKNALYYIASVQKGNIYIHFEKGKDENMMYFRDTGAGVSAEVLPRIFNRFYTKTEGGVGIGLSFCKMAMEWMRGDITCQSIYGEYTEFTLHFPVPRE